MLKRTIATAVAVGLIAVLAPVASSASNCGGNQLFIRSAVQQLPQNSEAQTGMVNPGSVGCANADVEGTVDTAYIVPGATVVQVVATNYPQDFDHRPIGTATIKFNNTAKVIQWKWDAAGTVKNFRWNSQVFTIPAGTKTITAVAKLQPQDLYEPPETQTIVYQVLS